MNKEDIINKILNDLPSRDLRSEMTNNEWYGWFEEAYDKALEPKELCQCISRIGISGEEFGTHTCRSCGKEVFNKKKQLKSNETLSNLIDLFIKEELPNANEPYHYEAEGAATLKLFKEWTENNI